jgi:hypothetical protein
MATGITPLTDGWVDQVISLNSRVNSLFYEWISVVLQGGNDCEQRLKLIVNNVVIIYHNVRTVLCPLPSDEGLQVEVTETTEPAAPRKKVFKKYVKKTLICFKCHGEGHFARECPSVGNVKRDCACGGRKRSYRK